MAVIHKILPRMALLCILWLASACGDDGEAPMEGRALLPLTARRGADAGIYDSEGRQVLLRGVNVNSLGDYYQDNPELPPVLPLSEEDFREMAALGFNVVRLIVSWSALEPQPGEHDARYLERIREAVRWANTAGLYVVLDMHQDAWGKYIATPRGTNCGGTREPAIGWDGAPEWATITDGRSTCRSPGVRELAPAVSQAFENFYADREGIQTAFVRTWAYLAGAFAREAGVAGYDLFNEPHWGTNIIGSGAKLTGLYGRLIPAIREAERAAGGFPHIVFFEPVLTWPEESSLPDPEVMNDPHLVFAPHSYAERGEANSPFAPFTIEQVLEKARMHAQRYEVTFWIGEYGWFSDPPSNKARVLRYAAEEDRQRIGSAWWVWKQACGDPHSILVPGGNPPNLVIRLHYTACPGDIVRGLVAEWAEVLSRPYPRAVPGRLLGLASDPETLWLELEGEVGGTGVADLWFPARGGLPRISGAGLRSTRIQRVAGGYRIFATVEGRYRILANPPQ
ncbi:MAG: hypothetical protein KatS3mg077_2459 [Candidatus Binatia bacterium]|nr:MAG: hypothetical protein KatS3mg077_2459 [Candidatus Binatia bacterium]